MLLASLRTISPLLPSGLGQDRPYWTGVSYDHTYVHLFSSVYSPEQVAAGWMDFIGALPEAHQKWWIEHVNGLKHDL
jgi:hypothetical protein